MVRIIQKERTVPEEKMASLEKLLELLPNATFVNITLNTSFLFGGKKHANLKTSVQDFLPGSTCYDADLSAELRNVSNKTVLELYKQIYSDHTGKVKFNSALWNLDKDYSGLQDAEVFTARTYAAIILYPDKIHIRYSNSLRQKSLPVIEAAARTDSITLELRRNPALIGALRGEGMVKHFINPLVELLDVADMYLQIYSQTGNQSCKHGLERKKEEFYKTVDFLLNTYKIKIKPKKYLKDLRDFKEIDWSDKENLEKVTLHICSLMNKEVRTAYTAHNNWLFQALSGK